jgi:hypothetical protein
LQKKQIVNAKSVWLNNLSDRGFVVMPKYKVFVELKHMAEFLIEAEDEDHARAIVDCGEQTDDECVNLESLGGEIAKIEEE